MSTSAFGVEHEAVHKGLVSGARRVLGAPYRGLVAERLAALQGPEAAEKTAAGVKASHQASGRSTRVVRGQKRL